MKTKFTLLLFLVFSFLNAQDIGNYTKLQQLGDDLPAVVRPGLAALNGKIYILGGLNTFGASHVFQEFDPATNALTELSSINLAQYGGTSHLHNINGVLYTVTYNGNDNYKIYEYDFAQNTWLDKAETTILGQITVNDMGTYKNNTFVIGTTIYVLHNHANNPNHFAAYNTATDTWTLKNNLPNFYLNMTVFSANGKGYVCGGETSTGAVVNTVLEYDPPTDAWTPKANMPFFNSGYTRAAGATYNNMGYLYGSYNNFLEFNSVLRYNPANNTWTTHGGTAPRPTGIRNCSAVTLNNDIYYFGGSTDGNANGSLIKRAIYKYNITTDSFSTVKENIGQNRMNATGAYNPANNKVYIVGGQAQWSYENLSDLHVYDVATNTWEEKVAIPSTITSNMASAVVNNTFYCVGGEYVNNAGASTQVLAYNIINNTWSIKANLPIGRKKGIAANINGQLYAGLGESTQWTSHWYQYNATTNTWVAKAPCSYALTYPKATVMNNQLYVSGYVYSSVEHKFLKYDPLTDVWEELQNINLFGSANIFTKNGKIYQVVYNSPSSLVTLGVYEYDELNDSWEILPYTNNSNGTVYNSFYKSENETFVQGDNMAFFGFGRTINYIETLPEDKLENDWYKLEIIPDNNPPTALATDYSVNLNENGVYTLEEWEKEGLGAYSTDNVEIVSYEVTPSTFTCADVGNVTATLTVYDEAGNSDSITFNVAVNDPFSPEPVAQDVTVYLDANGEAVVTTAMVENGSTDNCTIVSKYFDNDPNITTLNFDCSNVGNSNHSYSVVDSSGNTSWSTAGFNVTVIDNIAPIITNCPTELNVSYNEVDGGWNAPNLMNEVNVSDNCSNLNYSQSISEGSYYPEGTYPVTLSFTDAGNNLVECTFNIIVSQTLGIDNQEVSKLSFHPNPTSANITFTQEIENLEIFDITGKKVKYFENSNTVFNVADLEKGVYLLKGKTKEGNLFNQKLIIE